jgi:hypothetical protein
MPNFGDQKMRPSPSCGSFFYKRAINDLLCNGNVTCRQQVPARSRVQEAITVGMDAKGLHDALWCFIDPLLVKCIIPSA